jgi:hypothetical protein
MTPEEFIEKKVKEFLDGRVFHPGDEDKSVWLRNALQEAIYFGRDRCAEVCEIQKNEIAKQYTIAGAANERKAILEALDTRIKVLISPNRPTGIAIEKLSTLEEIRSLIEQL